MQGENEIGMFYRELATSEEGNSTAKNIGEFKASVQKNGGYYIARRESSKSMSQNEASSECQDLYAEIKSDLMNSYAWDTAIVFIQNKDSENTNYSNKTTGNEETEDVVCNIYDMSGNMLEWTTETSSETGNPYVARGESTSSRHSLSEENTNISFRSILYW